MSSLLMVSMSQPFLPVLMVFSHPLAVQALLSWFLSLSERELISQLWPWCAHRGGKLRSFLVPPQTGTLCTYFWFWCLFDSPMPMIFCICVYSYSFIQNMFVYNTVHLFLLNARGKEDKL